MVAKAFFVIPFAFWKLDFNSTNDGLKYSGGYLNLFEGIRTRQPGLEFSFSFYPSHGFRLFLFLI
jgi:hypothetical protein